MFPLPISVIASANSSFLIRIVSYRNNLSQVFVTSLVSRSVASVELKITGNIILDTIIMKMENILEKVKELLVKQHMKRYQL